LPRQPARGCLQDEVSAVDSIASARYTIIVIKLPDQAIASSARYTAHFPSKILQPRHQGHSYRKGVRPLLSQLQAYWATTNYDH
jgi:hypothetical protein